ncbi:MAG: hypothetical protein ACAH95_10530 [Fimbriimonas sp.]
MQAEYKVVRTSWTGSRYTAQDAGGNELYTIRSGSKSAKFFPPGAEMPQFEMKALSFFSTQLAFVESSDNYVFGYLKPKGSTWLLLNVAESQIGVFQGGLTREAVEASIQPIETKGLGTFAALKLAYQKAAESARFYELLVEEKPVLRFEMAKDRKSVDATVLSQHIKDVDERVVLMLAVRCFVAQQDKQSG